MTRAQLQTRETEDGRTPTPVFRTRPRILSGLRRSGLSLSACGCHRWDCGAALGKLPSSRTDPPWPP